MVEVTPPPTGNELVAEARQHGRPARRLYRDGDRVIFGWAGHTSDHARMMPLGSLAEVRTQLRDWIGDEAPFPLIQ